MRWRRLDAVNGRVEETYVDADFQPIVAPAAPRISQAQLNAMLEYLCATAAAGEASHEGGSGGGAAAAAALPAPAAAAAASPLSPAAMPSARAAAAAAGSGSATPVAPPSLSLRPPPVHPGAPGILSSGLPLSGSASIGSVGGSSAAGGGTPALLAHLRVQSPRQANRANRLLTAGCPKAVVKALMALGSELEREAQLDEEEAKLHLEELAPESPFTL